MREPKPSRRSGRAVPAADIPTPATLGRPLTLKEKLAAARAGGAPQARPRPPPRKRPRRRRPLPAQATTAPAEAPKAVPPPAKPLGRPMTLQEKLAAARGGGRRGRGGAARPAAKPAAAPAAKAAAARVLPPLGEITDPKDLAEAARQAAAKKAKELAAAAAAAAPPRPRPSPARPSRIPFHPGPPANWSARRRRDRVDSQSPRLLRGQPVRPLGGRLDRHGLGHVHRGAVGDDA